MEWLGQTESSEHKYMTVTMRSKDEASQGSELSKDFDIAP